MSKSPDAEKSFGSVFLQVEILPVQATKGVKVHFLGV